MIDLCVLIQEIGRKAYFVAAPIQTHSSRLVVLFFLVDGGVAAEKLHTNSSQGEYIATNSTVAGRAQNRRVDVVFANHEGNRTPVAQNQLESAATR